MYLVDNNKAMNKDNITLFIMLITFITVNYLRNLPGYPVLGAVSHFIINTHCVTYDVLDRRLSDCFNNIF